MSGSERSQFMSIHATDCDVVCFLSFFSPVVRNGNSLDSWGESQLELRRDVVSFVGLFLADVCDVASKQLC